MKIANFKCITLVPFLLATGLLSGCVVAGDAYERVNGSYTGTGNANRAISRVNGSIQLTAEGVAGKLSTVNGSIRIAEKVSIASAETVNGSIKAATGLKTTGSLQTVNGSIETAPASFVQQDVTTVNGSIRLHGTQVGGKVQTVNGNISLMDGAVVQGDIIFAEKKRQGNWFGQSNSNEPTLTITADSRVEGKIILRQPVQLKLEDNALAARVVREY